MESLRHAGVRGTEGEGNKEGNRDRRFPSARPDRTGRHQLVTSLVKPVWLRFLASLMIHWSQVASESMFPVAPAVKPVAEVPTVEAWVQVPSAAPMAVPPRE